MATADALGNKVYDVCYNCCSAFSELCPGEAWSSGRERSFGCSVFLFSVE